MTSNPAIFEKAIAGSSDYERSAGGARRRARSTRRRSTSSIAIRDIQDAADILRPVYDETARRDGYVSLEVSPLLAVDTAGTLDEARRLWRAVGRAEPDDQGPRHAAGHRRHRAADQRGHQRQRHAAVRAARSTSRSPRRTSSGLERFAASGGDPAGWPAWRASSSAGSTPRSTPCSRSGCATTTRASRRCCARCRARWRSPTPSSPTSATSEIFSGAALAGAGGSAARRRSACCGPAPAPRTRPTRDVLYVEELIGPDTVNTIPPATFDAFRDHGRPRAEPGGGRRRRRATRWPTLADAGISHEGGDRRAARAKGCACSPTAFDKLLDGGRAQAREALAPAHQPHDAISCRRSWRRRCRRRSRTGRRTARCAGCGQRDASLWTRPGRSAMARLARHRRTSSWRTSQRFDAASPDAARAAASRTSSLLGMGGSSLGPEVHARDLRQGRGLPGAARARLDRSGAGRRVEERDRSRRARCSSSRASPGATLEPNIFKQYFFDAGAASWSAPTRRAGASSPSPIPARRCSTSPRRDGFRHVFFGWPSIGGRYSALSDFGMVPAAVDGHRRRATSSTAPRRWSSACAPIVPADENPGVVLGHDPRRGCAAAGRDKVTFVASPAIARSRRLARAADRRVDRQGRQGHRSRSIASRSAPPRRLRRRPRCSSICGWTSAPDAGAGRRRSTRWSSAGQPVVRIALADAYDLGAGVLPLGDRDRRGRARSSASIRSISPTSRRARSRPAS